MPDIFVPRDTTGINSYYNSLVNNDLIQEYAMIYTDLNRDRLDKFASWRDLHTYLQRQPLLLNLVSYADSKGIRRRPYYIEESKELLESQLNALIIRNFWGEEGFYSVLFENDILIDKAIELFESGKANPESVKNSLYVGLNHQKANNYRYLINDSYFTIQVS